jgi:hypothetical protein
MTYDHCIKNKLDFKEYFNDFLELGLIRDWDFSAYTDRDIDDAYRAKFDKLAKKYGLVPRAKTFILYQTRNPIQLDDQALFEIAVLDGDDLADLELPMTTMKVKINRRNLKYVYMFAKCFYQFRKFNEPIDIDIIKHMIKNIHILMYPYEKGLFKTSEDTFDVADLSKDMVDFIEKFANKDRDLEQFLVTQIAEPHRMCYRLLEKNIPKVVKITEYLESHGIVNKKPDWMFNENFILSTINNFMTDLGKEMLKKYKSKSIKRNSVDIEGLNKVSEFIEGINLNRIRIEYDKFPALGKELVNKMFLPIYEVLKDDLDELPKDNSLVMTLKFLKDQKLFD